MKKIHWWLAGLGAVIVVLALTNPKEADYREHVRQKQGIGGTLGIAAADLLSGGRGGGIKRDNFLIASRFYIGGDGLLPRQNLAWGIAGLIREIR